MSSNFPSENETSLLHIIIEARRINEAEITIDLPRTTKKWGTDLIKISINAIFDKTSVKFLKGPTRYKLTFHYWLVCNQTLNRSSQDGYG